MIHIVPAAPPQAVPIDSGFDYVAADSPRRRVYAAHTGSDDLLIVDSDSGKVLGQVSVGPMQGVAVDPASGRVFTGDGIQRTVSEVDPTTKKVLRSVAVPGNVDAVAYDPANGRIYADEDDGTRIFVIDAKTMKHVATVAIPGHKPEYLAIDPETHDVYQNIDRLHEVAVVDGATLKVKRILPTPELRFNHPLVYDATYRHIIAGGLNGVLASYDRSGKVLGTAKVGKRMDQCDLDRAHHRLACAGDGQVTVVDEAADGKLTVSASLPVPSDVHTLAFDQNTGRVWIVWAEPKGDFVQQLRLDSE
ncbi:MAG: YncE family protein [Candidatus Eremiobacteraeota bacterium]|nr:YncE family protein [Candidatus Eremiobacteraeota bacterium]